MTLKFRSFLLLPLVPLMLLAQGHPARPNFSGGWVMGDSFDDSMKTGTDSPFMRVEHQEPRLKVTISVSSKSSQKDVWSLTTDGAENLNRMNGNEVRSRTHWQGDSLVTEWATKANGRPMKHRQVWSVSKDGKHLTMNMRDGDSETIVKATRQ